MVLWRQILSMTRLSVRRLIFTRFMFAGLLLAALPILILVLIGVGMHLHGSSGPDVAMLHNMQERILREFYCVSSSFRRDHHGFRDREPRTWTTHAALLLLAGDSSAVAVLAKSSVSGSSPPSS